MTQTGETRTAREIAIDFYRAEWSIDEVAAAEMVEDLSVEELASISTAVAAAPHLAPR
jgi:hypothetical protein